MNIRTRTLFILSVLCLCTAITEAQTITISAPSQVEAGRNFRLSYTVSDKDARDFKTGSFPDGIEVVAGPYSSTQSSYQFVNGKATSSSSVTYTYTLYAAKNGTYTIPEATARVDGKEIKSSTAQVSVVGTASQSNGSNSQQNQKQSKKQQQNDTQTKHSGKNISKDDLFVTVTASKKRVYEQEPILLTYKVYTLVNLTQLEGKMPDLTGFHTQEIPLPQQKSFHVEEHNGKQYRCVTWSQYVMYPQMTGKLTIPSITFKGIVVVQNRFIDPFEAFFNGGVGYEEVKHDVTAPAIDIDVMPLPKRPDDFSGGVGSLSIKASADNTAVKAGEPITVHVETSGTGNLKLLKQPDITVPKDFDKYDPKVTDKTRLTTHGLEGSMIYEFLIVPRNQGKYTIPPVELVYFDLTAKDYKTVRTEPITLDVAKGDGTSSDIVDYSADRDSDIRPIKRGTTTLSATSHFFFASAAYWIAIAALIIAFILLLAIFRNRAAANADVVKARGKKANKAATKRLKAAAKLMSNGKQNEFYDEVMRALWGYVGDKLNIPVERLTRDNITEKLANRGIETQTIDTFIGALDECEFERYAPGDAAGNMEKTYSSAMEAITQIETSLKTSKKRKAKSGAQAMTILIVMLATASTTLAATKEQADAECTKGNYQEAIALYEEILDEGVSAEVYYNLGNAHYRTGNITQAIIAYERALALAPGDSDIRFNLQFVNNKTIDKIAPRSEMFFVTWYRSIIRVMSVDGWARTAVASLAVALLLLLLFLFSSHERIRRAAFYGSVVLVAIFLLSNLFAYQQKRQFAQHDYAIVTSPTVNVKKTPATNSEDVFVIHEGTKVDITDDDMDDWRAIQIADGREGWISTADIEEI